MDLLNTYSDQIIAFTTLCALIGSLASIVLTAWTLQIQRKHNRLSVMPIAAILIGDYENRISVSLKNTGVGPMIVETFQASDGTNTRHDLISLMPALPDGFLWDTYWESFEGLCIPPNEEIEVLQFEGEENNKKFANARDRIRKSLSEIHVTVRYKDIYDQVMPPKTRDLSSFGKH